MSALPSKKILILGGQGFIGSHLSLALASEHKVTLAARNPVSAALRFPTLSVIACDFAKEQSLSDWKITCNNYDVIINCIGVLQSSAKKMNNVHFKSPMVLFQACEITNTPVIHFSAIGANLDINTHYSKSKYAAEEWLSSKDFSWLIIKPSLVIAHGSYGGTSLIRALSSLPFIPVVQKGQYQFQPIAITDIIAVVRQVISKDLFTQEIVELAGPEKLSIREILERCRAWLGFGKARIIEIPVNICWLACKIGDWLKLDPFNSTSLIMMTAENIATHNDIETKYNIQPKSMVEYLWSKPSCVQDRWHAYFYCLKPILKILLSFFWIFSGLIAYTAYGFEKSYGWLLQIGLASTYVDVAFYSTTGLDIILGSALLFSRNIKPILGVMSALVMVYTLVATWAVPYLWLDPVGALLKNLTVLMAMCTLYLLADER